METWEHSKGIHGKWAVMRGFDTLVHKDMPHLLYISFKPTVPFSMCIYHEGQYCTLTLYMTSDSDVCLLGHRMPL